MKKIIINLILIICLLSSANFQAATKDIKQLEDGVLTVGTNCQYAPFEYIVTKEQASDSAIPIEGSNAYCEGYDMMWLMRIADALDIEIELVSIDFAGLVPALNSGSIELIASAMNPTPERREELAFTNNYYDNNLQMSIVTRADGEYANAKDSKDFAGAEISYGMGTANGEVVKTLEGINVVDPLEGADILIQATLSGTIDGYFTDYEAAAKQAASNDQLIAINIDDIEVDPSLSGYAFAAKLGEDDLVNAINDVIDAVSEDEKQQMMIDVNNKIEGSYTADEQTSNQYGEQLADGVFTIGTDCAYAPYAFALADGEQSDTAIEVANGSSYCDGYDMMIASEIADTLGVELEVQILSFDGLIPALNSGQIDAIIAGMSPTPDRREQLDFSDNYYDTELVMSIVVNNNGKYANAKGVSDFKDAKISSQLGTFHSDVINDIEGITVIDPMESPDVLMQATIANTIDGYLTEHEVAVEQAQSNENLTYVDLNDFELNADFSGNAVGIKKGSDQFTSAVNQALGQISQKQRTNMMNEATAKDNGTYTDDTSFLSETWELFITNKALYAKGIKITLTLALFGTIFGTLIGFVLVAMRIQTTHYKDGIVTKCVKKTLSVLAIVYIDIIRGTPMMVQAMLFFYGVAANFLEPNTAGIVIISFNTAAYVAEILRSGINSLDSGQMEAGRSLGLSTGQTFMYVIIPQTVKNTLPALANQLILNIKDSSVLSVIGVSELFFATKQAASAGYMYTHAYFISAVIYLFLTIVLTRILNIVMRKLLNDNRAEKVMTLQNIEEAVHND